MDRVHGDADPGSTGADGGPGTEPFELVSHEHRTAILRALAERQRAAPTDPFLGFAELRERAGVDDPGNFNYHLGRLVGRFVEKTPAGYRLTYPGTRVVAALAAGAYSAGVHRAPADLPGDCPLCGAPLVGTYEDGLFRVTCDDSHEFRQRLLPSALEGRSVAEAATLMTLTVHQDVELARRGVCPECHGRTVAGIERVETDPVPIEYAFQSSCERCGMHLSTAVGGCVARHPAVVAFHHDHGVDLRDRPFWALSFCRTGATTVESEDPLRVTVRVALDAEELRLTLSDDAEVVDTVRAEA